MSKAAKEETLSDRQEEDRPGFTAALMDWHRRHNDRNFPWKEESSAYKIWLSEIILQQTRAAQGLPYYLKFASAYPTVKDLAAAPDDEAFKLWQGLGYYARCRNMLATARQITNEYGGTFPDTYEGLLKLKGIGPYTAAALASFAYGLPHAVVDGNVYRVLARYFVILTPTHSTEGKKLFQQLADKLLDRTDPGGFNQAIMDLGATVCTPASPKCGDCPVSNGCAAKAQELTGDLPVRKKKTEVKTRYFHYLLLHYDNKLWIRRRSGRDIWKDLYEPLLIESDGRPGEKAFEGQAGIADKITYEGSLTQRLTHQVIESTFFSVHTDVEPDMPDPGIWVSLPRLKEYPYPRTLVTFFEKKGYF